MRVAPLRWLAWLLVAVIAYGLYNRVAGSASNQDLASINKQAAASEQRLARLREQTELTDRRIEASIDKTRAYQADMFARATFSSDFMPLSMLKIAMVECYYNDDRWPEDGCGIELDELRGGLLREVAIGPGGVIAVAFQAGHGLPDIAVRLQPRVTATGVHWLCSSPDYAQIGELLAHCQYRPEFSDERGLESAQKQSPVQAGSAASPRSMGQRQ